jgi:lipopolysaccharide assembly outer membrane protein LptD (OstA)
MSHKWRIIKWLSLCVSLGSVVIAVALMRMGGPEEITPAGVSDDKPQTRVESPVIVERKDGKVLWQLRAQQARQQLDGQMHLIRPRLILSTEGKREIPIESEHAWFDPLRRNIRFEGNVSIRYATWRIYSEKIFYSNSKNEVSIPGAFRFERQTMHGHGKNLRLLRTTERLIVMDGIWIEDSDLRWQGVKS